MKVKAKALRMLVLITLISTMGFIVSSLVSDTSSILSVILSGVLGSSLVSLIVVGLEYSQEKRDAIEKLYCEAERIKNQINKNITYIRPEYFDKIDSEKIKQFVDGYMEIINIDLTDLGFLYADICFVTELSSKVEKCKKRYWIYENVYSLLYNYIQCAKKEKRHFDAIINAKYKKIHPATYETFSKMQNHFFTCIEKEHCIEVEATFIKTIEENDDVLLKYIDNDNKEQSSEQSYIIYVFSKME